MKTDTAGNGVALGASTRILASGSHFVDSGFYAVDPGWQVLDPVFLVRETWISDSNR